MHPELPGLPPGPAVHLPMFDQQDARRERPGPTRTRESDRGFARRHDRGRERFDRRHGPPDEGGRVVPALTRSVEQAMEMGETRNITDRSFRCICWCIV